MENSLAYERATERLDMDLRLATVLHDVEQPGDIGTTEALNLNLSWGVRMVEYFCPKCWQATNPEVRICPHCGWNLAARLDYVEKLVLALDCPEAATSRRATYLLGLLGDRRAVPHLMRQLGSDDPYVAMEAVNALARIGSAEALQAIREARNHRFAPVRKVAREILTGGTGTSGCNGERKTGRI